MSKKKPSDDDPKPKKEGKGKKKDSPQNPGEEKTGSSEQKSKEEKSRERTNRRSRCVQTLIVRGTSNEAEHKKDFIKEREFLLDLFYGEASSAFDLLLGPIIVGPKVVNGEFRQDWVHFPMAYTKDMTAKAKIAHCLLTTRTSKGGPFLLPRSGRVFFGPGRTVFHVGWEFARWLRESLCRGDEEVFRDGTPDEGKTFAVKLFRSKGKGKRPPEGDQAPGNSPVETFDGAEWFTDSFEFARLIAPLCAHDSAPRLHLAGRLLNTRSRQRGASDILLVDTLNPPVNPTFATLVMGCRSINSDGHIFADTETLKDYLGSLVATCGRNVIVLAKHDDFGDKDGDVQRVPWKDGVVTYVVTDQKPALDACPRGIKAIYWPGGQLSAGSD